MPDKPDSDKCIECPYCVPESACLNRLQWMDSLVESLRFQLAKALALNRIMLQAVEKVADIQNIETELGRLTAKILQEEVGQSKGPQNEEESIENLSDWH